MDYDPYLRHAVHVDAKLFAATLRVPVDCIIRNLSERGALLAMELPVALPRRVYLSLGNGGCVLECDVRWWKANRLFGIRFSPNNSLETRYALVKFCSTREYPSNARDPARARSS